MTKIDIDDIRKMLEIRARVNSVNLKEVIFYDKGVELTMTTEIQTALEDNCRDNIDFIILKLL